MQSTVKIVGKAHETDGQVQFVAAYWAWLRGQRTDPPKGQEFALAESQAAGLIRQIQLFTKSPIGGSA
jgi:hypothetical protein